MGLSGWCERTGAVKMLGDRLYCGGKLRQWIDTVVVSDSGTAETIAMEKDFEELEPVLVCCIYHYVVLLKLKDKLKQCSSTSVTVVE